MRMGAAEIIAALGLEPHPEGGWYAETFRDSSPAQERARSTAIYFLLEEGNPSRWHRVRDAAEVWHFYAGAPAELKVSRDGAGVESFLLGNGLAGGERPQIVIPAGCWQAAGSLGAYTLCGCTVAPGFDFSQFEMAPAGFPPALAQP
jgi:predicted cupin superfamily sugar epimerase